MDWKRLMGTGVLLAWCCMYVQAQDTLRTSESRTVRLHNGTEVTEVKTKTVVEEETKPGKKKSKIRKPKDMKYRVTLLEAEFETEKFRKELAAADPTGRRNVLQRLIDRIAGIQQVKHVEYDDDYTTLIIHLPDDTEYRIRL